MKAARLVSVHMLSLSLSLQSHSTAPDVLYHLQENFFLLFPSFLMVVAEGHLAVLRTRRAGPTTAFLIDRLRPAHNTGIIVIFNDFDSCACYSMKQLLYSLENEPFRSLFPLHPLQVNVFFSFQNVSASESSFDFFNWKLDSIICHLSCLVFRLLM